MAKEKKIIMIINSFKIRNFYQILYSRITKIFIKINWQKSFQIQKNRKNNKVFKLMEKLKQLKSWRIVMTRNQKA